MLITRDRLHKVASICSFLAMGGYLLGWVWVYTIGYSHFMGEILTIFSFYFGILFFPLYFFTRPKFEESNLVKEKPASSRVSPIRILLPLGYIVFVAGALAFNDTGTSLVLIPIILIGILVFILTKNAP